MNQPQYRPYGGQAPQGLNQQQQHQQQHQYQHDQQVQQQQHQHQQQSGSNPAGPFAPGTEQMMQFAAATVSDNMSNRFNNAVPILGAHWTILKYYFEVDNRYVLSKLRAIVFSALLKGKKWKREETDDAPPGQDTYAKKYATPANDENAPDLYLPLMSFVTYIVVCSYIKGTNGKFTPEVLSQVMYFCLGWQLLEILVIKCGLYTLQQQSPFLDLVANTGYKYVGLCINMLVGMLLGRTMYYVALLWTGTMTSYFMLKTLSNNYARQNSNGGMGKGMRLPLLWSFALLQFLSIWVLGYGGEL